jgi:hypothetical protein
MLKSAEASVHAMHHPILSFTLVNRNGTGSRAAVGLITNAGA